MADEPRTFKVTSPLMRGSDIRAWQDTLVDKLVFWGVDGYPLVADGVYGVSTRAATATVLHGMGIAQDAMLHGVTPELRTKVRNARLSQIEKDRYRAREDWRASLVAKWAGGGTAAILAKIITHAHGFKPGHDGADLICPPDSPAFAIVRSKVVRVSDSWWGIGNPGGALGDRGDGIVILKSLVTIGPHIRSGDLFGYGHGERPRVKVGDVVEAGRRVCDAGHANASHLHAMQFRGDPGTASDGGPKGIGNRDPWPAIDYCIRNA